MVTDDKGRTAVLITAGECRGERGWAEPLPAGRENVQVELPGLLIMKAPGDFRALTPAEALR